MSRRSNKVFSAFAALATVSAAGLLTTPTAFAATSSATVNTAQSPSLVALGDSITFGYNLTDTKSNSVPSAQAYPYLIGQKDNLKVTDLGIPGWASDDLLAALQNPNFDRPIEHAGVVTVDIGSNDLLGLASQMGLLSQAKSSPSGPIQISPEQQQEFVQAITAFGQNLGAIVAGIRQISSAPILLYNMYNPFPGGTGLYDVTEQLETAENQLITKVAAGSKNVVVVDAHTAFDGHQLAYVRIAEQDVHPTPLGQSILANLGEQALAKVTVEKSVKSQAPTSLETGDLPTSGGTVTGKFGTSTVTLTVPSGVLNEKSEVDVTSEAASNVSSLAPANTKVVTEFGVNFMAAVKCNGQYQVAVANPAIPANGAVYQVISGKLTLVQGAKVSAGKATFAANTGGDFVVLAPVTPVVPSATKPVTGLPVRGESALAGILVAAGALLMWATRRRKSHQNM